MPSTGRLLVLALLVGPVGRADDELPAAARRALERAVRYLDREVSVEGSYVSFYSADLAARRGDEVATATEGRVEPPGTPTVGEALLDAYQATGEALFLDAARRTGRALTASQLSTGGWDTRIEFDPDRRLRWHYRTDVEAGQRLSFGRRNRTVYDDGTSASALRFLLRLERATGRTDDELGGAIDYAVAQLLASQYPNGAWPRIWEGRPRRAEDHPRLRAEVPDPWPRTWPDAFDERFYVLSDHVIRDNILLLIEAHRLTGSRGALAGAIAGGDFLLDARLSDDQPVWSQHYDFEMHPVWGRRFEPPAAWTIESVGALGALVELWLATGEERFRAALGPAIDWLVRTRLEDGSWARFYELGTDRPLYLDRDYQLTDSPDDAPGGRTYRGNFGGRQMVRDGSRWLEMSRAAVLAERSDSPSEARRARMAGQLEERVRAIVAAQDEKGRWLIEGEIDIERVCENLSILARYASLTR